MTRRIGPVERITRVVYLTLATTMALAGLSCALFTVVLIVQWTVEAMLPW